MLGDTSEEARDPDIAELPGKGHPDYNEDQAVKDMINKITWQDLVEMALDEESESLELMGIACKSTAECKEFARWLSKECPFRSVDMSQCWLTATQAGIICQAVSSNTTMKHFSISGNDLGNDSFFTEAAEKLLKENNILESIDFSGNELQAEGAKNIAEGLKANGGALTLLDLGGNKIKDEGAKAFAEVLASCHENFKHLDLLSNHITEAGAHHLAHAVEHCEHLEILRLDSNVIRDTGALHFAAAIRHNPKLCKLTLCSNEITFVGKGYLDAASEAVGRPADMQDVSNNPTDIPAPPDPAEVRREPKTLRKRCGLGLAQIFRAMRCGRRHRPNDPLAEQLAGNDVTPANVPGSQAL